MARRAKGSERRQRRFRLWHIAVIVLLAIVAIPLGSRVYWQVQLRGRIKALAAAGYPIRAEQMDVLYPLLDPDQENLADSIVAAGSLFELDLSEEEREVVPVIGRGELPPPGVALSAEAREVLARLLDDHRVALGHLQCMSLAARCRYRLNWTEGFKSGFSDLDAAHRCASLLGVAALCAFDEGDSEQGVDALARALVIGRSVSETPLMWGRHSLNRALKVLEWGLGRGPLTVEQLDRLNEALGQDDCPESLVRGMVGWRCLALPLLQAPDPAEDNDLPPDAILDLYCAFGLAARETVIYIDMIESYIQAARLPLNEWQSAAQAIDERVRTQVAWCLQLRHLGSEDTGLSHNLIHGYTSRARLDTAHAGLAIERYRLAKGRLPETLADLVPQYLESVPLDPFDGAALRYQMLAQGFVVYSIGRNGWDDGGTPPAPGQEWRRGNWDITFTIER